MLVEIPDDIVRRAEVNSTDLQMLLAVQLYSDNRISHVDACRLSGLTKQLFNHELLMRGITIQQSSEGHMGDELARSVILIV